MIEIMKTTEQSGRFCAFLVSDKNFAMGQDRLDAGNNVLAIFVQTWRFKDILTEKASVTLRWKAMDHEKIKYINFVDDERPQFVFIILLNTKTNV